MRDESRGLFLLFAVAVMTAMGAFAFQPIPKESAKALKVTRARPFSAGAVFINGKYVEPPYVVERWGTGIRINKIPVTGQIVDWNEFLKTQAGVRQEKKNIAAPDPSPVPAAPAAQPADASSSVSDDVDASSLDDLFDDDPKPARGKPAVKPAAVSRPAVPAAPRTVVSYVLEGEFKMNEESKALRDRINAVRTEIDRILRSGGFICFGDNYSRVTGDKRTFLRLLDALPELQQRSRTLESFRAGVRTANLVYLNEVLCEELYRNRVDYRKLKERREKLKSAQKWEQIIEDASDPLF